MKCLVRALPLLMAMMCSARTDEKESTELLKPPLRPGQVLDPDSQYAKTWPGKPALFKLKDNLILQIPPQFHQFWAQLHWITGIDRVPRPPMPLDKIPAIALIGFVMHRPDFEGYTPDNYLNNFDLTRVEIVNISPAPMSYMEPGAPGSYAPNALARNFKYRGADPEKYEDLHGLRCYAEPGFLSERTCYGRRDSNLEEYLILRIKVPPYESHVVFPTMRTSYFSPKYGGLEISWRSHMQNFPHWREIDAQIWKYLDAWNIAGR